MTGNELATLCAAQKGMGYVWGGLGYTLTESRVSQLKGLYPKHYTDAYVAKCRKLLGKEVYDCAGLIKHFLWGNAGDGVLRHYNTNGIPDTTANCLLNLCKETGTISDLPELPGLLLWQEGHVGVYLGGGKAVEARGIDYGVVITDVAARGWKKWGKLPTVEYSGAPTPAPAMTGAEAIAYLAAKGIITSPEYWTAQLYAVKHLDALFVKFANAAK